MGDVGTASEKVSTSEETPRKLSDDGPGIYCLSIEEVSHFEMRISDNVEPAIRGASDPYAKPRAGDTHVFTLAGGEFTKRKLLVRLVKSAYVDLGGGRPANSKTPQLSLARIIATRCARGWALRPRNAHYPGDTYLGPRV